VLKSFWCSSEERTKFRDEDERLIRQATRESTAVASKVYSGNLISSAYLDGSLSSTIKFKVCNIAVLLWILEP